MNKLTESEAAQLESFFDDPSNITDTIEVYEIVTAAHPSAYAYRVLSPYGLLTVFASRDLEPQSGDIILAGKQSGKAQLFNLFQPDDELYDLLICSLDVSDRAGREGLEREEVMADCWGVVVWFQPAEVMAARRGYQLQDEAA